MQRGRQRLAAVKEVLLRVQGLGFWVQSTCTSRVSCSQLPSHLTDSADVMCFGLALRGYADMLVMPGAKLAEVCVRRPREP